MKKLFHTMNSSLHRLIPTLLLAATCAAADPLAAIHSPAELDALIAKTTDTKLQQALTAHSAAIAAAVARQPHVEAVAVILEKARGTFEKGNDTPESLQAVLGGPSAVFDTLKTVSLADASLGIKSKRESDPFDESFYHHLGQLAGLESLVIIHTAAQNAWLAHVGKLTSLKTLRITNQAKLGDEGLAHLAALPHLEQFSFIGTGLTGAPFKDFKYFAGLKSAGFRGSKMSDEGLMALCAAAPNLENLGLAHAHFSDAAAASLASLKKLAGLEIGSPAATPACLKNLRSLPLAYLQLGDGLDSSEGIAIVKDIATLKRLTLTHPKEVTDTDLKTLAAMRSLEALELGDFALTDARLPLLKDFAFLKSVRLLAPRNQPYTDATKAAVQAALPKVELKFE